MDVKSLLKLPLLLHLLMYCFAAVHSLCDVETGDVIIIVDIRESFNDDYDQLTDPAILPITGNASEIRLKILLDTEKIFALNGKQLKLIRSLDRDAHDVSFIQVQLQCTVLTTLSQRTIPVTVRVIDINDNTPKFLDSSYKTSISEVVPVGTTVFRGLRAEDDDSSVNGLVDYFVVPRNDSKDGFSMFSIDLPNQGFVTLRRALDYEKCREYEVAVVAIDRASKISERLTSTTTLTIKVLDADDQDPIFGDDVENRSADPAFEYWAHVATENTKSDVIMTVNPAPIRAHDQDTLNSTIHYSFSEGTPSDFIDYFAIDNLTAEVRQIKKIEDLKSFNITIKAEEQSEKRRYATAILRIIWTSNESRPILAASNLEGFVLEKSPVGSAVQTNQSGVLEELTFNVTAFNPKTGSAASTSKYGFELTSDLFAVDTECRLVVISDLANVTEVIFTVMVRDDHDVESNPVPITVQVLASTDDEGSPSPMTLDDPILSFTVAPMTEPIVLTQIQANDIESDQDGDVAYSLEHASNDGQQKFKVHERTGIVESTGPLKPGEHYSLTIGAANRSGRTSHRVLEVDVAPLGRVLTGQFTFKRDVYEVRVNEGAAVGTIVMTLPMDPTESYWNMTYSIVTGNNDGAFQVNPATGALSVRQSLDREKTDRYELTMIAKDNVGVAAGQTMTATVNVQVTDINDNNPSFVGEPYSFTVDEGRANLFIGTVKAVDADSGANGLVYYSMPSDSLFRVDPVTGEVSTRRALDHESQPVQYAIVTALDGARDPRIATATVTIVVNDVPDEVPVFEHQYYEASVPENVPYVDVLQIRARDPDAYKQITYIIREGPPDRFTIDPVTGIVRTTVPLDYEESQFYMLTIGARENFFETQSSNCIVKISVLDRNDIPPLFTSVPPPMRIQDTIGRGTVLATVIAIDSDGTPPNNLVKYTLGPRHQSHFDVDHDVGTISLKGDLSKDPSREFYLEVRAYDLGSPQLTATTTVTIYVDHTATLPPEMGLAFPDDSYTIEIEENALGNIVVKSIPVINQHFSTAGSNMSSVSFDCEIQRGNNLGHFFIQAVSSGCELRTKGQMLDYETGPQYQLTVTLKSATTTIDSSRSVTDIKVRVKDTNDNRPLFVFQFPVSKLIGDRYVTSLSRDAAALTPFTKITAVDHDSGSYGHIRYSISRESDPGGYFIIDSDTGLVSNSRTFDNSDYNGSFFELTVTASDNPKSPKDTLNSTTTLAVNLVSDEHRLILVILDAFPDRVAEQRHRLTEMLQDNSNMVVHVEKIESRKYLNHSKMSVDGAGTDVWFNVIDPHTLRILNVSDDKLSQFFLSKRQQRSLLYSMSTVLKMDVEEVRIALTIELQNQSIIPYARRRADDDDQVDGFQAGLMALGGVVAILGLVGVIYLCFIWSRFTTYRDRMQRLSMAPRYEPVLVEPNLKTYETQVLQMIVQTDDDSGSTGSLEEIGSAFEYKNGVGGGVLDNVSFMTKDGGSTLILGAGRRDPSDESDSLEGGDSVLLAAPQQRIIGLNRSTMSPAHNPVYHSSDENGGSPVEGSSTHNATSKQPPSTKPRAKQP